MARIRLTKEFSFETAHTLQGYDGACREIHGHSYRLFVTVRGEPTADATNPKVGMALDFSVLKKLVKEAIIERYDHALLIRAGQPDDEPAKTLREHFSKVIETPYQPTCENLVADIARTIAERLPVGVELFSVRLHETATSFAEWFAEDN